MNLLEEITIETGLRTSDAERIIGSAPKRYKQYLIPKRDGGLRMIAQPSRELKLLQRLLADQWLKSLPVHRCATAYVNAKNIVHNARLHRGGRAIPKLDFESFFPSLRVGDWKKFVEGKPFPWDGKGDLARVSNILFWGQGHSRPHCLSIGAPTSPIVAILLMFDLDERFSERAAELVL